MRAEEVKQMDNKVKKAGKSSIEKKAETLLNSVVTVNLTVQISKRDAEALDRLKGIDKDAYSLLASEAFRAYNISAVVDKLLVIKEQSKSKSKGILPDKDRGLLDAIEENKDKK